MEKKLRINLKQIILECVLPIIFVSIIGYLSTFVKFEDAKISISESVFENGQYISLISVNNFKNKNIDTLSLFFSDDCSLLSVQKNDYVILDGDYIKITVPPKEKISFYVLTENKATEDTIRCVYDGKIVLNYQNSKEAEFLKTIKSILIIIIIYSISIIINFILHRKMVSKIAKRCDDIEIKLAQSIADAEKAEKKIIDAFKRYRKEKIFYQTRISQLRKELNFWRDTIRKLLYDSKHQEQFSEKILEAVTNNLKTYTTSDRSDNTIDDVLFIAELISKAETKEE